jgi:hypothetical protein
MEECADSSQSTLKPFLSKRRIIVRKPSAEVNEHKSAISVSKNIKTMFFVR